MTYEKYDSVIQTIELINEVHLESEYSVIKSFLKESNKSMVILENCYDTNSFEFFQESKKEKKNKKEEPVKDDDSIMGRVKKYGANDKNKAVTVLAFIPRIIAAICSKIAKIVRESKIGQKFKKTNNDADAEESLYEKELRVAALNKMFEGKCETYLDRKDGKIKFKKSIKSILVDLAWAIPAIAALSQLLESFNRWTGDDPTHIQKFAWDIEHMCKNASKTKPKDIWNTLKEGIKSLGDLLDDADVALLALDAALVAVKHKTDKALCKLNMSSASDPKKEEKIAAWNKMADSLLKVSTTLTVIIAPIAFFKKHAKEVTETVDNFNNTRAFIKGCTNDNKKYYWYTVSDYVLDKMGLDKVADKNNFVKIYEKAESNYNATLIAAYKYKLKAKTQIDCLDWCFKTFIGNSVWAYHFEKKKGSEVFNWDVEIIKNAKLPDHSEPFFNEKIIETIKKNPRADIRESLYDFSKQGAKIYRKQNKKTNSDKKDDYMSGLDNRG